MTTQRVTKYCLSKPGAVQDYPFGSEPAVFKVGGKVFATIYQKDGTTRFGMKCDPMLADLLRGQYSSVTLMYKSPNWIYILCGSDAPDDVVFSQIDHSYDLVFKALPRKTRELVQAEVSVKPEMSAGDVVEIFKMLEQHDIEVYVDGGWGVDALLGEHTRKHSDLDIALPHRFVSRLRELLEARSYKEVLQPDTWECNFVMGDNKGHLVDVHSYTFDENGKNIFGVAHQRQHLTGTGIISGYPVKCPPPEVMVGFHTGYDTDEDDYRDVKALCERFGVPLPKEYGKFST